MIVSLLFGAFGCAKPAPAPAPAPAPTGEKYGGVFRLATSQDAQTFGDPLNTFGPAGFYGAFCIQKLLKPTATPGVYEPVLATSWELAPDESHYIFHLRKGVKFHDGTDFNAQAVKWNLDRVIASGRAATERGGPPGPPPGGPPPGGPPPEGEGGPPPGPPPGGLIALSLVDSVDVVDDYTIRINLSRWNNMVLFDLAIPPVCGMISPTAFEKNGEDWVKTNPIGTAAFKIAEYKRSVSAKYERFDDYWEEGLPYLDGVEIILITDPMTQIASLKSGDVEALNRLDIQSAKELMDERQYDIPVAPPQYVNITPNANDPDSAWADIRMREALEYAINKERITETIGCGLIDPLYQVVGGCPGHPNTVPRKHDPEKAKQLMAEAGYPDGVKCKLYYSTTAYRDLYIAMQASLAEVGIEMELEPLTMAAMMQFRVSGVHGNELRVEDKPGGATLLGPTMDTFTGTFFNPDLLRPAGSKELTEQILREKDDDKRVALFEQLEEMVYTECITIPLWTSPSWAAYTPNLKDYKASSVAGPDVDLSRAWFSR